MKILTLPIALAMPVVASASPINLLINGGFEAGNTGFTLGLPIHSKSASHPDSRGSPRGPLCPQALHHRR